MENILSVNNLHVEFNAPEGLIRAVKGVSFNIPKGKTVAIVGESGSGKSVISQSIMGILPKSGSITDGKINFYDPKHSFKKTEITSIKKNSQHMRQIRGSGISIIFQEPMTSLSPLHTIGNQIAEGYLLHNKVSKNEAREATIEILDLVGFPNSSKAVDIYPFELSGGLRQRAMIAMAMICRPALLIADEPTTALDVTVQAQILKLMKDLQSNLEMAILMITHDLGVVANMADEIIVMYHGEIMEYGSLEDIFHDAQHPYLKSLLKAVPRFGMGQNERLIPIREISSKITSLGSGINQNYKNKVVLEVKNLSKTFTTRKKSIFSNTSQNVIKAIDNVSFDVPRGDCVGLVGESGCGKTTTSKIIMGALKPDTGNIIFNTSKNKIDVLNIKKREEVLYFRKSSQYIFQDPYSSLNPRMTVFDIINEPLIIHNLGSEEQRLNKVKSLIEMVGLPITSLRRYPHSFSGGQRQRIGIARALALEPEFLICDEPVSALDVSIQAQVLNLLKDLKNDLGLTYLFISHNLAVIDYISDYIIVMCAGRIVEKAPKDDFFNNAQHPYTRALLGAVPEPNPNKKLNFQNLMDGKASNPSEWPEKYIINEKFSPKMNEIGNNHWVLSNV